MDDTVQAVRLAIARTHALLLHALVLVKPGSIAKTSSGKIQRHASRQAYLDGTLTDVGHWVEPEPESEAAHWLDSAHLSAAEITQKLTFPSSDEGKALLVVYLQQMIAGMLGRVTYQDIGLDQTIDTLGLDSLRALELKNQVELDFGLIIPMNSFLEGPTLGQLADTLANLLLSGLPSAEESGFGRRASLDRDEQPISPAEAESLLANLDQLSEDEADSLLASLLAQENKPS
jgi:acyl carrier protein